MAVVTTRQLLDAGVHFGHQTRRWNPKMKRFIFTERNGIYIIDLQQTLTHIDRAYDFVKSTVAHGGSILFVGTKRQAQEAIEREAGRVNMPYVTHRWLGGMLTNFTTVHKRLQRLKDLEAMETSGEFAGRTKKEVLLLTREKTKLAKTLGGIRDMGKVPSAVWIVDTKKEHIAVKEARKLGIPVVAILDTNCDPDEVDYPLPGNDDAIRSAALLTQVIADGVAEGLLSRSGSDAVAAGEEPLAEWEREMLESGDSSTTAAPQEGAANAPAPNSADAPASTDASESTDAPATADASESTDAPAAADVTAAADAPASTDAPAQPDTDAAAAEAPTADAAQTDAAQTDAAQTDEKVAEQA